MTIRLLPPQDRTRRAVLLGLAGGLASFSAVAAPVGDSVPYGKQVRSFLDFRQRNVVLQRWDLSCGAASLATLLTYQHADPVSEQDIAAAMLEAGDAERVRKHLGFSLLDLKRYVQSRGYQGDGFGQLGLGDLAELAPAIIPIHVMTYDHFVVFRGFARGRAVMADSAFGNRTMLVERFLDVWQEGRIAFVVRRPGAPLERRSLTLNNRDLQLVDPAAIRVSQP